MIKLRSLRWGDYLGPSVGPSAIQGFLKVEWGGRRKITATMKQCELDSTLNCWLLKMEEDPESRNAGSFQKLGRQGKVFSMTTSRKEHNLARHHDFIPVRPMSDF